MIRIVSSSNRKATAALLSAARVRDRRDRNAGGGDRGRGAERAAIGRCAGSRSGSMALPGAIEVPQGRVGAPGHAASRQRCAAPFATPPRHIRRVARAQVPKGWRLGRGPRRDRRAACGAAVARRLLRASRPPSPALVAADERDPRPCRRRRGSHRRSVRGPTPPSSPPPSRRGVDPPVPRRRCARRRRNGLRDPHRSARGQDRRPGNRWVSAAKSLVTADCAIDFYAGPTEILIVASRTPSAWVAADLIAQAEHDPTPAPSASSPAAPWRSASPARWPRRCRTRPGPRVADERTAAIVVTRSVAEAIELANACARRTPRRGERRRRRARRANAGAVFVGPWTAQVAGDYAIGSNHVLPTAGAARMPRRLERGRFREAGVGPAAVRAGLRRIAGTITTLARAEGLEGHARSIESTLSGTSANRESEVPATSRPKTSRPSRSTRS